MTGSTSEGDSVATTTRKAHTDWTGSLPDGSGEVTFLVWTRLALPPLPMARKRTAP